MPRTRRAALVLLTVVGLLLVPAGVARSEPERLRPTGEEFGPPFDWGSTAKRCSTGLACTHAARFETATGLLESEVVAKPTGASPVGQGAAFTSSQLQAHLISPEPVAVLRVTADVRVLAGSAATVDVPSSFSSVQVVLAGWRVGCQRDCAGLSFATVLSSSAADDAPSATGADIPLRLTTDVKRADGGLMDAGTYAVLAMVNAGAGHPTYPTLGTASAKVKVVVDRVRSEVLPAA